ncbi:dynamin family protein [Actinospica sp. MGRD01-02]|uniref:Dynamin family protein n=1 Tax=Actinospica acidithermotolerans TaxID=2828514 RepID=A0A941IKA4_9ACTN|nr:dynamin family protein [Actinospica acidithermotolerans]MBR7827923.1 dynamin family protein [Actinospica acidithermotolerans]
MHDQVADLRELYARKMSVALIGRVSSGKSTLANALLGGAFAATGIEELTYNVSWLRRGTLPGVTVHFTDADGRPPERRARDELDSLATRAHADARARQYLAAISYLDVVDPCPALEPFDLIDTPGLDAVAGTVQTRKTLGILGRTVRDMRADTVAFAARADALILVFPRAMAGSDAQVVDDFLRAGLDTTDPITAVGVLTQIEKHWPRYDPMTKGAADARRLMAAPYARQLLFELKPVAGKLAAGAALLDERDYEDLCALSRYPQDELLRLLELGNKFRVAESANLPLPAARRTVLFDQLSGYGIHLACDLVRGAPDVRQAASVEQLRERLVENTGLPDLRRLLSDHFARRADVIKLRRAIGDASALPKRLPSGLDERQRDRVGRAAAMVTDLEHELVFRVLNALGHYQRGELGFTVEEGEELLRVSGEHGVGLEARLGLPTGTPGTEMAAAATARRRYWSAAARSLRYQGPSHGACEVMRRAYDGIAEEIRALETSREDR